VKGHQPPRGGSGDLRKRKAQAAPGLSGLAVERKPSTKGIRFQVSGISKNSLPLDRLY
jgi:hypothetical protein